jgi:pyruvate,water dikinase
VPFEVTTSERGELPQIPVKIAMNIGNPQLAFGFAQLPNAGVGLARLEFIINNEIGVHPRACLEWPDLPKDLKAAGNACRGYADPGTFFREKMVEGVATIAAAFWPKPVIVRLSDFKSNEYRKLIGGERYEPEEENRCSASAAHRATSRPSSAPASSWSARRCARCATSWGSVNVEIMVPVRAHRTRSTKFWIF